MPIRQIMQETELNNELEKDLTSNHHLLDDGYRRQQVKLRNKGTVVVQFLAYSIRILITSISNQVGYHP